MSTELIKDLKETSMNITPSIFKDVMLQESCWIDGTPHFTRRAIGEWLEYDMSKRDPIGHIIRKNPHIEQFSVPVYLSGTDGKNYEQKFYNPIGLQLIIFESRQPKAKAYKVAVANLVYAFMRGELKPSKWSQKDDLVSAARQILSLPCSRKRGSLVRDLAERDGVSIQAAYRRVNKVSGKRLRAGIRSDKGATKYPEDRERVFAYVKEHPEARGKEIVSKLSGLKVSFSRVNEWLRERAFALN
jgi:transposase